MTYNSFKSCLTCGKSGKPTNTDYNEGFICLTDNCPVIFYGREV